MIKVTVQKNLIALEDLLVGVGTVEQTRGPSGTAAVTVTKINGSNIPYDGVDTMGEKFDALQLQIDNLPEVVDEDGIMLTGLINTSAGDLDLAGRLWRKTIDSVTAEIYYGTELLFQYNPTAGNIYIPGGADYVAADIVVTNAYIAADVVLAGVTSALDTAVNAVKGLAVGTSANNLVQLDGSAKLPAVDGSALTGLAGGVPIGTVIWASYDTPDSEYVKCDGGALNRTTYATLFGKIGTGYGVGDGSTTFNVPDLRGEFVRCWDDTRGIDAGRTIGSAQSDSLKAHTHAAGTLTAGSAGAHTHDIWKNTNSDNTTTTSFDAVADGTLPVATSGSFIQSAGAHTHAITGSTASTGASETRPRNVALMAMIKVL